jgi:hypothetical protein
MYYGLSWVLGHFVRYPAREYEGKTLYLTMDMPLDLVRHYKKKYLESTDSASAGLIKGPVGQGLKCPLCGAVGQTKGFCTECGTQLREQSLGPE